MSRIGKKPIAIPAGVEVKINGSEVTVKGFKQMMNSWRYDLEELGVHYRDYRSNGIRMLEVKYIPSSAVQSDASAVSDETNSV